MPGLWINRSGPVRPEFVEEQQSEGWLLLVVPSECEREALESAAVTRKR
jgi:hypothetical protein